MSDVPTDSNTVSELTVDVHPEVVPPIGEIQLHPNLPALLQRFVRVRLVLCSLDAPRCNSNLRSLFLKKFVTAATSYGGRRASCNKMASAPHWAIVA